jgi:hypothetical protein
MHMGNPMRARWAMALGTLAVLVLAGCDGAGARAPAPDRLSSQGMLRNLRWAVHATRSDVRDMRLLGACTLRIRWDDATARSYDLLRVHALFPQADDGERYALALPARTPDGRHTLVATSDWGSFTMARASLNNLRGLCAASRASIAQAAQSASPPDARTAGPATPAPARGVAL